MRVTGGYAVATAALDESIIVVPLPVDASKFQTLRIGRVVRSAGTRRRIETVLRTTTGATVPVLIGSLLPLTGRAREDGMDVVRCASLAIYFRLAHATRLAHDNGWDLIPVGVSD